MELFVRLKSIDPIEEPYDSYLCSSFGHQLYIQREPHIETAQASGPGPSICKPQILSFLP
jgi:hypothetical protein